MRTVALVGTSSTGKTTVYELLQNRLWDFEFINESTRTVKGYGFPINEDGTDATQLAISSFHLEALLTRKDLLLDRCYLDLVVYTSLMENVSNMTKRYIKNTWKRVQKQYTHLIYFPIEFQVVEDGIRSVNEEWRKKVDDAFKTELTALERSYLTVTGSPNQRINQILKYIRN